MIPDSGRFQGNKALEEIASPTFHPEEREIRSENRSSAVAWVRRVYRYRKGSPVLVREEETRIDPKEGIREVTVREMKGGEWAETSRERASLWTPIPLVLTLNVKQEVTSRHPGWEIQKDTVRHRVTRITVYDGRPEEGAALRYSDLATRDDSRIATWELEAPVSAQGYWISVHYAATSAVLFRALPAGISTLRVVTSRSRLIEGFHEIERVEVR